LTGMKEDRMIREANRPIAERPGTMVAVAGRIPAADFPKGNGRKFVPKVAADNHLGTSLGSFYAAGDCAEPVDGKTRKVRRNFGRRGAVKQGRLAGNNMEGGRKTRTRFQEDKPWRLFETSHPRRTAQHRGEKETSRRSAG
jgi:NADPH-dependent 2,4-dienoyl-CoA reductase/sulfur reductase-like enzyme